MSRTVIADVGGGPGSYFTTPAGGSELPNLRGTDIDLNAKQITIAWSDDAAHLRTDVVIGGPTCINIRPGPVVEMSASAQVVRLAGLR